MGLFPLSLLLSLLLLFSFALSGEHLIHLGYADEFEHFFARRLVLTHWLLRLVLSFIEACAEQRLMAIIIDAARVDSFL